MASLRVYRHRSAIINLAFSLLLFLCLPTTPHSRFVADTLSPSRIPSRISYPQNCGQIVQETQTTETPLFSLHLPSFTGAHVINGGQLLGPTASQITAILSPRNVFYTVSPGVFKVDASLTLRVSRSFRPRDRRNLLSVHGGPGLRSGPRALRFSLSGLWDSGSGRMCMVGLGSRWVSSLGKALSYDVVFNSNYPNNSVITSSLVSGTLESLSPEGSESHFGPISMLGFARTNYDYTLVKNEASDAGVSSNLSMGLGPRAQFRHCYQFRSLSDNFELGYKTSCEGGRNCSLLDGIFGFLPRLMSFNEIDCTDQKMIRVAFGFSNGSDIRNGYRQSLDPSRTLVAEGVWDAGFSQLRLVACRIVNFTENPLSASVGDCSVRLNFTFPSTVSIRSPSVINGNIWSNKSVGEEGYFDNSDIRAFGTQRGALPFMRYEYTEIERAKRYCGEKKVFKHKGGIYPNNPRSQDMKFDINVRNSKGQGAWGRAHPVFFGDQFVEDTYAYFRPSVLSKLDPVVPLNSSYFGLQSVTYLISFSSKDEFKVGGRSLTNNEKTRLSGEGIYDTETGRLCMVGCWNRERDGNMPLNASKVDCDIFVDIQLAPTNAKSGDVVKGTIESKREKSDPLYFERLDLSATSLTKTQLESVFWRMDFEIAMVLISNTLACIFVGLQLFHVKRCPDALPFISVMMLSIITLGHMIPLLLNMEAFFLSSPQKKTVLFGSGGWLEVNEVLVRVITMVAFLLEFRLLQLTWSSRGDDERLKGLWASEKKVISYSLPLFAFGALIIWILQKLRGPTNRIPSQFRHLNMGSNASLPFWHDIKSYAGFMLDAFLLPQILFNIFSDSKDMALSFPYYFGTTITRLMPHVYDLYRAHSSARSFDVWYIYANPEKNYFSASWDILISCLGLLFVVLVYLQQRFGGRWVLPKRFRENVTYEKVPVGL